MRLACVRQTVLVLAAAACLLLQCSRRTVEASRDPSASRDAAADVAEVEAWVDPPLSPTRWFDEVRHCGALREIVADIDDSFHHLAPEGAGDRGSIVPSGFARCEVSGREGIMKHPHIAYECTSQLFASSTDAELARGRLAEAWGRCLSSGWSRDPSYGPAFWLHVSSTKKRRVYCALHAEVVGRVFLRCGWASPD